MIKEYLKLLKHENFKRDREKINQENRIGLDLIIVATFLFLSINMLLRIRVSALIHRITLYLEAVYFLIVIVFYFFFLRKRHTNFTLWIYLFEIPVLLIAMFDAVHYEPNSTTFLFMIFLLLFPMFILDQLWRIVTFIVLMAALYAIAAARVEPPSIYAMDMIHLINVSLLSIGSTAFFLIVRLRSIKYADHVAVLAEQDPLTGLYNRAGAQHYINPEEPGIFVYLDLDRFKSVNDSYGHEEGDLLLQKTAEALRSSFRKQDIIIRLGGDEFAVFSPGLWKYEDVEMRMKGLLHNIRSISIKDDQITTASAGCAYAPHGCGSLEELMRMADQAMYEAKHDGKNDYRIVTIKQVDQSLQKH